MTYTPKPGDRVTSPFLVGEWEVPVDPIWNLSPNAPLYARVKQGRAEALVPLADLTPVAPPLPPEPAVGEVVWARGRYWARQSYRTGWHTHPYEEASWADLAADAEPVVPVSKVADWLGENAPLYSGKEFLAEFGWGE